MFPFLPSFKARSQSGIIHSMGTDAASKQGQLLTSGPTVAIRYQNGALSSRLADCMYDAGDHWLPHGTQLTNKNFTYEKNEASISIPIVTSPTGEALCLTKVAFDQKGRIYFPQLPDCSEEKHPLRKQLQNMIERYPEIVPIYLSPNIAAVIKIFTDNNTVYAAQTNLSPKKRIAQNHNNAANENSLLHCISMQILSLNPYAYRDKQSLISYYARANVIISSAVGGTWHEDEKFSVALCMIEGKTTEYLDFKQAKALSAKVETDLNDLVRNKTFPNDWCPAYYQKRRELYAQYAQQADIKTFPENAIVYLGSNVLHRAPPLARDETRRGLFFSIFID